MSGVWGEESGCSSRSDLEAFSCFQCRPLSSTELCGATSGSSHLPLPTQGTGTEVSAELQAPWEEGQWTPAWRTLYLCHVPLSYASSLVCHPCP